MEHKKVKSLKKQRHSFLAWIKQYKLFSFITLVIVIIAIPFTIGISLQTTQTQNEASICGGGQIWKEIWHGQQLQTLNHPYIHVFELEDAAGNNCQKFYAHVDLYLAPHQNAGNLNVGLAGKNGNTQGNILATQQTYTAGSWYHIDQLINPVTGSCVIGTAIWIDNNNANLTKIDTPGCLAQPSPSVSQSQPSQPSGQTCQHNPQWVDIWEAQDLQPLNHPYLHVFELEDGSGNSCNQFYMHGDLYIAPHQQEGYLMGGIGAVVDSNNYSNIVHYNGTGNAGTWTQIDSKQHPILASCVHAGLFDIYAEATLSLVTPICISSQILKQQGNQNPIISSPPITTVPFQPQHVPTVTDPQGGSPICSSASNPQCSFNDSCSQSGAICQCADSGWADHDKKYQCVSGKWTYQGETSNFTCTSSCR